MLKATINKQLLGFIFLSILIQGCSSVKHVKKDPNYNKLITETSVNWLANKKIQMRMRYSARSPYVSGYKKEFKKDLGETLLLYKGQLKELLSTELNKNSIHLKNDANTKLNITPVKYEGHCDWGVMSLKKYSCDGGLTINVALFDTIENKQVWSADFETKKYVFGLGKENILLRVVESIIEQLQTNKLLLKNAST